MNDVILNTSRALVDKRILYSECGMGFACNPELAKHYSALCGTVSKPVNDAVIQSMVDTKVKQILALQSEVSGNTDVSKLQALIT